MCCAAFRRECLFVTDAFTDDGRNDPRRCVQTILNGIEELPTRADLLDRCVLLSPTIPRRSAVDKEDLLKGFEAERPRLLGLCWMPLCALRRQSQIKLAAKPGTLHFGLLPPNRRWACQLADFAKPIVRASKLLLTCPESSPIVAPLRAL